MATKPIVIRHPLWLGIDQLFTRDAATGEPAFTFVARLTRKRPQYPKTADARETAPALPLLATARGLG